MSNMKVGTRLALGFGLVLLLLMLISALGVWRMSQMNARLDSIVNDNVYKTRLLQTMSDSVHTVSRVTRSMVLLEDLREITEEERKIEVARGVYDDAVAALDKTSAGEEGMALRARIRQAMQEARPLNLEIAALAKENRDAEATERILKQAGPATTRWQDAIDENVRLQDEQNKSDAAAANAAYASALRTMLILCALAMLAGGGAALAIARGLLRQLGGEPGYAVAVAAKIAAGDLSVNIKTRPGDRASILYAMQAMRDSLAGIVGEVRTSTETIAAASSQIASGNLDLSSRTEEQASSLEETASSMEELTSTVKQNADNARQANSLAVSASDVAGRGGAVVAQVVETMGSINESAKKIVDIIGVIDGIAFQTNILALNAAVEAARAGEQGRGFAVVASEVRNLAQRSAAAAKEIKVLIDDSVEKVDSGTRLVDQAGATMKEIVASVRRVTDIMEEITAASQEQTSGIEQINQAISQMDEVTQQNASLVEEAAAAAQAMQDQAGNLTRVVGVFQMAGAPAARLTPALQSHPQSHPVARRSPTPMSRPAPDRKRRAVSGEDWDEF